MVRIAFAWSGLPDYAARCMREVAQRRRHEVTVIGTPPTVPIEGMEDSLGQHIHWVDGADDALDWTHLGPGPPDVFFQGGYVLPAFRKLGRLCRAGGGHVVGMSDADWRGSLRQRTVDSIRHRLFLRRAFDGLFVPGRAGAAHARNMGYDQSRTHTGVYGADPDVFHGGDQLSARTKTLIFVGRLEPIKNVLALVSAFTRFAVRNPEWRLELVGEGSLARVIPRSSNVSVSGFLQPGRLADKYREARCLILPSLREPWGLVVHEAALSGCALALSRAVGARHDLACLDNAVVFDPDQDAIESGLDTLAGWNDGQWARAESSSRERAQQFGPRRFADTVDRFVEMFAPEK